MWLGDGGMRDYQEWEGRKVYLYNPATGSRQEAGTVRQWKRQADSEYEAGKKNLTGSDVWSADFVAAEPGRYRIVVEGVGCSPDFEVSPPLIVAHTTVAEPHIEVGEIDPPAGSITDAIHMHRLSAFAAVSPLEVWRKSKPVNTDSRLHSELEHRQ